MVCGGAMVVGQPLARSKVPQSIAPPWTVEPGAKVVRVVRGEVVPVDAVSSLESSRSA